MRTTPPPAAPITPTDEILLPRSMPVAIELSPSSSLQRSFRVDTRAPRREDRKPDGRRHLQGSGYTCSSPRIWQCSLFRRVQPRSVALAHSGEHLSRREAGATADQKVSGICHNGVPYTGARHRRESHCLPYPPHRSTFRSSRLCSGHSHLQQRQSHYYSYVIDLFVFRS